MLRYLIWSVATVLLITENGNSARILAMFPFPGRSHFISFATLLEELSQRGHQLTVISAFPRKSPLENYKDVVITDYLSSLDMEEYITFDTPTVSHILMEMLQFRWMSVDFCDNFLNESSVQDIIQSGPNNYDLIIYEPFLSECAYGVVHKLNAPFMHISSNTISQWMGDGVGNPFTYSYIPDMVLGYTHHMSFKERLINTFVQTIFELDRNWITIPKMEAVVQKYFNDPTIPGILEIENNSSFLLLNSHITFNYPRPLTPNTAEVGGMHIQEPKKLPQDLQKLLDEASDGVIYFSLGTNVKSTLLPERIRNNILKSLSKLKQKILWKWENETLPGKPANIYISKWFPQSDILAHPNVKAFITHGGLLSTEEATYYGKPLIAIPIAADQKQNSLKVAAQGYAIVLNIANITEGTLDWALHEILTNDQYHNNAKRLSEIFRDQPQKPLERAVYWTEYVIRHKGAPHMRSAALKLNIFQYYLLDVLAVIGVATYVCIKLTVITSKLVFRHFFFKRSVSKEKTN
ncbi:hypothetical protein R5R35_006190 [Gryllus longicercus]|uniref:UDP-glucuronosyltransferase n=1 Tax=Gryllus longicercus TaxID=2509291 RepID=A0AAN9VH25_9ORTH